MLSEKEKEAIEYLKARLYGNQGCEFIDVAQSDLRIFLNLVKTQQKDIESWKKYCDEQENDITLKNNKICDLEFKIEKQSKEIEELDNQRQNGTLSDGYHTYNDLYYQRCVLFATICNLNKNISWKSKKHNDGKKCFNSDEWFIVGIDTPKGSYTYHYEIKYWDMFEVQELEKGKFWDGHTEKDVTRLLSLIDNYISKDKLKEILGIDEDIDAEKLLLYIDFLVSENNRLEDIEDKKVQIEYNNVFNKGVKSVEDKIRNLILKYRCFGWHDKDDEYWANRILDGFEELLEESE